MERVSSRQRLEYAWEFPEGDDNSSTISEEDAWSDYQTCLSTTMRASLLSKSSHPWSFDISDDGPEEEDAGLPSIIMSNPVLSVGTKRDRSGLRKNVSFSNLSPSFLSDLDAQSSSSRFQGASEQRNHTLVHSHSALSFLTVDDEYRSEADLEMTNVNAPDHENECLLMDILPHDVTIHVASFLSLADLRSFSMTCQLLRSLLLHPSNGGPSFLWLHHARQTWPLLRGLVPATKTPAVDAPLLGFSDDLKLPVLGLSNTSNHFQNQINRQPLNINASLLLGLSASSHPVSMGPKTICSQNPSDFRVMSSPDLYIPHPTSPQHQTTTPSLLSSSLPLMQYIGPVSRGERCIRSNIPLPKPNYTHTKTSSPSSSSTSTTMTPTAAANYMLDFVRQGGSSSPPSWPTMPSTKLLWSKVMEASSAFSKSGASSLKNFAPFVSPYVVSDDGERIQLDVTPRLASYFEVTIYPQELLKETSISRNTTSRSQDVQTNHDDNATPPMTTMAGTTGIDPARDKDCIAIGLSTNAFYPYNRMPGWDHHSWGYHSDDGGVFRGSGEMIRPFGPKFGPGDIVGCGIDYAITNNDSDDDNNNNDDDDDSNKTEGCGIFFTLNGTFLGYAWNNTKESFHEMKSMDLYPTVGIDSNCPISINYGTKPFHFDFKSFVQKKQNIVSKILTMSSHCQQNDLLENEEETIDNLVIGDKNVETMTTTISSEIKHDDLYSKTAFNEDTTISMIVQQ